MEDIDKPLAQLANKIDQLNTDIKSEFKELNNRVIEVEKSIKTSSKLLHFLS